MDLRLPYTFYPIALPHWIAWTLFLSAIAAGAGFGVVQILRRGWPRGLRAGVLGTLGFLAATMVASMVITFFVHDV
jgi:threonine/homoserine/homoserine lactone efflux protein